MDLGLFPLLIWYGVGLFGTILGLWYRYHFLYKAIKLVDILATFAFAFGGPFIWMGIVIYILVEIIDWDMTVVHKRDRY
jgi:hypothetical protein